MLFERSDGGPNKQLLVADEHRCSAAGKPQRTWCLQLERNTSVTAGCPHSNGDRNPLKEVSAPVSAADHDAVEIVTTPRVGDVRTNENSFSFAL